MKRHTWKTYYEALISSQEDCMRLYKTKLEQLECCFHESFYATEALIKNAVEGGFQSLEEEIHFFKEVKPKFTSHMIFFWLLHHNLLFEPKEDPVGAAHYWQKERGRLEKWIEENEDFYEYWKSGCKERDAEYFGHRDPEKEILTIRNVPKILLPREEALPSYDNKVATFIALEKYQEFIKGKLEVIYSQEN